MLVFFSINFGVRAFCLIKRCQHLLFTLLHEQKRKVVKNCKSAPASLFQTSRCPLSKKQISSACAMRRKNLLGALFPYAQKITALYIVRWITQLNDKFPRKKICFELRFFHTTKKTLASVCAWLISGWWNV